MYRKYDSNYAKEEGDQKHMDELLAFIEGNHVSSQEFASAYQIALGMSPEEVDGKKPFREAVFQLAAKLDSFSREGFPLTEIVHLIESKLARESGLDRYLEFISHLSVDESEKAALLSIVQQKRTGVLTVTNRQTGKGIRVEIKIPPQMSENQIAVQLIDLLQPFASTNIQIAFAPK